MKKLISSLVLVLVLCLAVGIALADKQDAVPSGVSYGTLSYTHHGVQETEILAYTGPTCTANGSAKIQCTFDPEAWHVVTVPAWGHHAWDDAGAMAAVESFINNGGHIYEDGTWIFDGQLKIEKTATPCVYSLTCDRYDPIKEEWTQCYAKTQVTVHYWSSNYDPLSWGKVTDQYTCVNGGQAQDYCIICGASREKYRAIEPLGHKFDTYAIVSYPQCAMGDAQNEYKIVDGVAQLVCSRCGIAAVEGDKDADGVKLKKDDLTKKIKVAPTTFEVSVEGGLDKYDLKKADKDALAKKVWPADLHAFDGAIVTKAPTCLKKGTKVHWCLRCGTNYDVSIDYLKHDLVKRQTLVDCFTARTEWVCSMCGKTYEELLTLEENPVKKDDKYNAYTEAVVSHVYELTNAYLLPEGDAAYDAAHPYKTPTCTAAGYYAYKCKYDGIVEGEHPVKYVMVAPALDHDWSAWSAVYNVGDGDNTTGLFARYCKRCGVWQNRHSALSPVISGDNAASAFVQRAYTALLGNDNASAAAVNQYADALSNGTINAAQVIASIISSEDFVTANPTIADKIDALYLSMLGRPAVNDPAGVANWTAVIASGASDAALVNGFAGSDEYKILCEQYGLTAGTVPTTEPRDANAMVTAFVNRCYGVALGRVADIPGLNNWTSQLLDGTNTPQGVAYGFVFSPEFDAQGKIAAGKGGEVVDALYALYLGRQPDAEGRTNWVTLLEGGMSLEDLNNGFANSPEFNNIVDSYGLFGEGEE